MHQRIFFCAVLLVSAGALANPKLADLLAQKRCTKVQGKANNFDCMVDQPDGSIKKTRFFQTNINKKETAPEKVRPPTPKPEH